MDLGSTSRTARTRPNSASASPTMGGRSSPSRWSAGCIIATRDAQAERKARSHNERRPLARAGRTARGYGRCRRATRACRAVANAREDAELSLTGHPRENGGQQLTTDDLLRNDSAPLTPDGRRCQELRRCIGPRMAQAELTTRTGFPQVRVFT
jgi:hypothetical protein